MISVVNDTNDIVLELKQFKVYYGRSFKSPSKRDSNLFPKSNIDRINPFMHSVPHKRDISKQCTRRSDDREGGI